MKRAILFYRILKFSEFVVFVCCFPPLELSACEKRDLRWNGEITLDEFEEWFGGVLRIDRKSRFPYRLIQYN